MGRVIGVIGCGNMGGALLQGFLQVAKENTYLAYTRSTERLAPFEAMGVRRMSSAKELCACADLVVLAVKPGQVREVLESVSSDLDHQTLLLSIAAGVTLSDLTKMTQGRCPLIRCMPDTPALVGKGVFAFAFSSAVPATESEAILTLFGKLGCCFEFPEEKFAAFSALIGAGPAYVFSVMQALTQAGVTLGFGHAESRKMVEALFEGSAFLAMQSAEHLTALRDAVCSPAGLTIDGVNELDRRGLTGILVDAVLAAYARGKAMESAKD